MDKDTYKSNVKTIKELILDEQKIVTYISVSKELCIHVNEAKSLLNHTIQDIRKSEPKTDIYVCYMISGLLNNNSACTTVCSETDVEGLRSSLKNIFYEHVYCVSRGLQVVDNVALTAINKLEDFPLCTGLIKAKTCIKRTDDEIGNLKCRVPSITNVSNTNKSIQKNTVQKPKGIFSNGHEEVKKVEVKSEPITRSKTPSPKKNASANSNKNVIQNNSTKPAGRDIAGFFNKSNGDSNKIKTTKVKDEKSGELEVKVEKEIKVNEEPSDTDTPVTSKELQATKETPKTTKKLEPTSDKNCELMNDTRSTTKKLEPTSKPKNKAANNTLKHIKKNAKVDKKRKRVLHVSDSESETDIDPFADEEKMAVDQESEDEIPATPSINTVKITSGIVNPKKRRKIVDKTYTDEEGYILTKKEEIYESCSDNEEDAKSDIKQVIQIKTEMSPKENSKAKKKKVSPPQKGKQPTLTNFFKKVNTK